jgi:hypothetical protein
MSRISYSEDEAYPGQHALWQANCRRSLAGKAGQAALRDLVAALEALPAPVLIAHHLARKGEVCAVGAVVLHRKVNLGQARDAVLRELEGEPIEEDAWDWEDEEGETEGVGVAVGIPRLVAWRLACLNDIDLDYCTPAQRYEKVLAWARKRLRADLP